MDLDDDIADFLIRRKQGNIVLELREKFSFQDQEKIEKRLIKNQNVDNFNKMFEVFTYHSKEEIKALLLTYGANPDILPK
ncbi:MAG: hypothetical protein LBH96_05165 [Candidatus Peribacteria bacterium]|nr:hypothetical protein [Candidatus Peribacteria bacterium]